MDKRIKKIGSLQIEPEALNLSPLFNIFQRIGIVLMFLILLGALLGLFGTGLMGTSNISAPEFNVDYDRFTRVQATNLLRVNINNPLPNKAQNTIWIKNNYFTKNIVKNIIPQAFQAEAFNNGIRYTFKTQPNSLERVTFVVEPQQFGFVDFEMSVNESEKILINQFIYP